MARPLLFFREAKCDSSFLGTCEFCKLPPTCLPIVHGACTSQIYRTVRCVDALSDVSLFCVPFLVPACAQQVENGLLHVGGFRCASLKPMGNDPSLDLYRTGYWNYTGFRMEVWRRLGVPFWYRKGTGVVRVAGEGWRPELGNDISSAEAGGKAVAETEGRVPTKDPRSIPMMTKNGERPMPSIGTSRLRGSLLTTSITAS